jgi:hypothetical protein
LQLAFQAALAAVITAAAAASRPDVVWKFVFYVGITVTPLMLLWGLMRVVKPVVACCVTEFELTLRSRPLRTGWARPWRLRTFSASRIQHIEIGHRRDFPTQLSYSDTHKFIFVVVLLEDQIDNPYYYASLQRVARGDELLARLKAHPILGEKVSVPS